MRELFWMSLAMLTLMLAGATADGTDPMLEAEVNLPEFLNAPAVTTN